jgi:sodium/potassium-transporting ATPase subunit alpha
MLTMGMAVVAVIFINAIFTFIQEYRAEKALEALKKLLPFNVKVIRNGKEVEAPAELVVPATSSCLPKATRCLPTSVLSNRTI